MISDFEAPIPGESLTTPPGNMPYERPPEIADPEEAIKMHLTRLSKRDSIKGIIDSLELGMDVVTLTQGYLRSAVAAGIHSIDVSLLAAPVVHRYIKRIADEAGIEYEEGLDDEDDPEEETNLAILKAKRRLSKMSSVSTPEEEMSEPLDNPEEEMAEEPMGGIMKRRGE